jgi:DNA-binding CsgD family transcriptional regulator
MTQGSAREIVAALLRLDHDLRRNLQLGAEQHATMTMSHALLTTDQTVTSALAAPPAGSDEVAIERARLITAILTAQSDARGLLVRAQSLRAAAVGPSTIRLRAATSVEALIRRLCTELTGDLEFHCASYSLINSGTCTTHWVHPHRDTVEAATAGGRELSAEEIRCIGRQRSAIIHASPGGPDEPMAALLGASTFVVAPVITGSEVRALIHATRELPWTVDTADTRLLDVVVSAFALIHRREELADRSQHQQQAIYTAARQLVADAETLADSGYPDLGIYESTRPQQPLPVQTDPSIGKLLTPRESDVLELIVAGASNTEIAEQLVITVETVKSHVKRVLRKLGAVNRSEAISLCLAQHRSPPW